VKNLFGCLPGVQKAGFHARLTDEFKFSEMLVDLAELVGPRLHIMDGVIGMEGNGPRNGTTRQVGVVLMSANPYALDYVVAQIMALDPQLVPTLNAAVSRGLLIPEQIVLLGDSVEEMVLPDYQVNRSRTSTTGKPGFWRTLVKNWITPRPVINPDRCTRCGRCVKVCPAEPKALDFTLGKQSPPQYDYDRCIRCYCCQEMCPEEAISVEKPALGKLLDHVRG
jgi:Pyruvate/2-oxoacid:ferredoxin oxidoreductase delta subunit